MQQSGTCLETIRYDYTVAVTTGAWTELDAALDATTGWIELFDSSGQTMELGQGPAGSETRICLVPPGGFAVPRALLLPQGMRLSIRAVSADATSGELVINLLG
jgi:hypothetical protein